MSFDRTQYDAVCNAIKRWHLAEHDERIARVLQSINPDRGARIDEQLVAQLIAIAAPYLRFHAEVPFVAPPRDLVTGPFILGTEYATGIPVGLSLAALFRHVLLMGGSGAGKTTILHYILQQLLAAGIKLWILEPKDDAAHIAVAHDDFLLLHPDLDFSPLAPLPFVSQEEQYATFGTVFASCFFGAEHVTQVLHAALTKRRPRSILELRRAVADLATKSDTYARRDALNGVIQRLERLIDRYPGIARATAGIPFATIANHSLYFPVSRLRDVDEFLWNLCVQYLFAKKRQEQQRGTPPHHVLTHDEGLGSWGTQRKSTTIGGAPPMSSMVTMSREFGMGIFVTTTTPSMTDALIKSNAATQIVLNLNAANDALEVSKTFGLDAEQTKYLTTRLCRGQAILKLGDDWREPILLTIPAPRRSKTVTAEEMQALKDRTDAIARRYANASSLDAVTSTPAASLGENTLFDGTPNTAALSETTPENDTINEAAFDAMSASSPPRKRSRPEKRDAGARLSYHETALLNEIARAGSILVAQSFRKAGLHPQAGDRAKKKLLALGFITQERVITRAGRGGTGICLEPTNAAYQQLGLKPTHATRGGDSAQHRFLVQRLHDLTGAAIEVHLAGKSVDLYLPHTTQTAPVIQVITEHSRALGEITRDTTSGIAIEVECSDPAKTAPENVRRNHDAGIGLTIVAVLHLKKVLDAIETKIEHDLRPHVLIIDVLDLFDLLEAEMPQ